MTSTAAWLAGFDPDRVDVEALEHRYRRALEEGGPGDLPVVGHGEISLAFGWPPSEPDLVVRSLPVFADLGRLQAYADLIDEYVTTLRVRGLDVVPTVARWAPAPGGWRGYLVQPALPAQRIGHAVLRTDGASAVGLLADVVARVLHVVDAQVGLDAQVTNWALVDGHPWYLDVGTPMLRDARGRDRLDVAILATSVPWAARPLVIHLLGPGILAAYHDPRRTLLDAAGNLVRERLTAWIPVVLELANPHLDRPLTEAEVHRFYRGNARMYTVLQALRRADRAWSRQVRRRPYPFLLPDPVER